ncbi:hypothetical protein E2C01_100423 [Portunus trituberculatus]|uniref:Uncharacterized protein n=1 Tax=Portunus trituberculatus TaxID=210409 RepID=A0A5B7KHI6_PORTR|nr:hypothetical protein [Portunus trituberculatus]
MRLSSIGENRGKHSQELLALVVSQGSGAAHHLPHLPVPAATSRPDDDEVCRHNRAAGRDLSPALHNTSVPTKPGQWNHFTEATPDVTRLTAHQGK